jgi:LemA protein
VGGARREGGTGERRVSGEDLVLYVAIGVPLILVLWFVLSYNRFVSQRNLISNSWSNIDTELKRRYELIPNLVETVKGYAAHERAALEAVTTARAAAMAAEGAPEQQAAAEAPLVSGLRQLLAVAESYPDLKASSNFLALQEELSLTEDRIQAARRFYNANVADFNRRVESIPSNVIAALFKFRRAEYFQIEPAMRVAVERAPEPGFRA